MESICNRFQTTTDRWICVRTNTTPYKTRWLSELKTESHLIFFNVFRSSCTAHNGPPMLTIVHHTQKMRHVTEMALSTMCSTRQVTTLGVQEVRGCSVRPMSGLDHLFDYVKKKWYASARSSSCICYANIPQHRILAFHLHFPGVSPGTTAGKSPDLAYNCTSCNMILKSSHSLIHTTCSRQSHTQSKHKEEHMLEELNSLHKHTKDGMIATNRVCNRNKENPTKTIYRKQINRCFSNIVSWDVSLIPALTSHQTPPFALAPRTPPHDNLLDGDTGVAEDDSPVAPAAAAKN